MDKVREEFNTWMEANDNNLDVFNFPNDSLFDAYQTGRASANKDSARLDWIERRLFNKRWNGEVGSGDATHWNIPTSYRHTVQMMIGHTFRDAIDAAIEQERKND